MTQMATVNYHVHKPERKAFTLDADGSVRPLISPELAPTKVTVRGVHSDCSVDGTNQRSIDILGNDKAAEWSQGHFAFINVWRPIGAPTNSAPLGFIRPSSVAEGD